MEGKVDSSLGSDPHSTLEINSEFDDEQQKSLLQSNMPVGGGSFEMRSAMKPSNLEKDTVNVRQFTFRDRLAKFIYSKFYFAVFLLVLVMCIFLLVWVRI
jgi:hypothetical protein